MKSYRPLTPEEIALLEAQHCKADDWNTVMVDEAFEPSRMSHVRLSGEIRLGHFDHTFTGSGGVRTEAGIHHVTLHNVWVGDGCHISNVHRYIANYRIGDQSFIQNVGMLCVDGESSFGNGVSVAVLNETGGREIVITDQLTSHQAYMAALYRHRPSFISRLDAINREYIESQRTTYGTIGAGVTIVDGEKMLNVRVGDGATLEGFAHLSNGTLASVPGFPIYVGTGVIMEDFIVLSGSHISQGAMLTRCFVGQACEFRHGYSATDSLFFCNCLGENGEACSIFAGPFTVTHHKSTLLISGLFSFMNAGSGSNQSNHMYKLGPIHQGTLERGAKTTSDSYILWPSRVGSFSLVMGRHITHSDSSNLPFSYLIENKNTTFLVPGVNLRSVGTIRDAQKWPRRDKRPADLRVDHVNYNLLSPFTIQKMMKGIQILNGLRSSCGELSDVYSFQSTKIKNSSLRKGIKYYQMAIDKFMGNSLISRLQVGEGRFMTQSDEEMQERLRPDSPIGSGEWVDVSGLIAPKSEITQLMKDVEDGTVTTISQMREAFSIMNRHYYSYEWTWAFQHIQEVYGINPSKMTREEAALIVERWKKAVVELDEMVYADARKEFDLASMTGYGADGNRVQKEQDFEIVRGEFETNSFVQMVQQHIQKKSLLAEQILQALRS